MTTISPSSRLVQGLRDQQRLQDAARHKEQFSAVRQRIGSRIGKILGRETAKLEQVTEAPASQVPTVDETLRAMEISEQNRRAATTIDHDLLPVTAGGLIDLTQHYSSVDQKPVSLPAAIGK